MGGFLSGLGTLLGGFADVKQIDKEGFDFREKRKYDQFLRDKAQEQYGTELAADYLTGAKQPDEATAATAFGPDVDRARLKLLLGTAAGKAAASKPAIEGMKANTALTLQALRGGQQERAIQLRGDEQQALARLRSELDAGREPNPRDKFIAEEAAKRTGMTVEGMLRATEMREDAGAGGAGRFAWNTETGTSEWVTPDKLASAPPGLYSDVATGRMRGDKTGAGEAAQTLLDNADQQLARYEAANTGFGRAVPAQLSPTKLVAWNAYLNSLQTLAQLMGRTVLGDNRVSEQDRIAYANAIGSTSQIVNVLDPTEARRRLDLLKNLQNDYNRKYGIARRSTLSTETSPSAPKVGDRKTFPNGRTGVWDGTGWRAE